MKGQVRGEDYGCFTGEGRGWGGEEWKGGLKVRGQGSGEVEGLRVTRDGLE